MSGGCLADFDYPCWCFRLYQNREIIPKDEDCTRVIYWGWADNFYGPCLPGLERWCNEKCGLLDSPTPWQIAGRREGLACMCLKFSNRNCTIITRT